MAVYDRIHLEMRYQGRRFEQLFSTHRIVARANRDSWAILFFLNVENNDRVKVILCRVVFANTRVRDRSVGRALAFQRRTRPADLSSRTIQPTKKLSSDKPRQFSESHRKFYKRTPVSDFDAYLDRFQVRGTNNNFWWSAGDDGTGFVKFLAGSRERFSSHDDAAANSSSSLGTSTRSENHAESEVFAEIARDLRLRVYAACKMPRCFVHPLIYGEI